MSISRSMPYWLTRNRITGEIAKPVEPVFADGESRGKAPKWLYRPFQFWEDDPLAIALTADKHSMGLSALSNHLAGRRRSRAGASPFVSAWTVAACSVIFCRVSIPNIGPTWPDVQNGYADRAYNTLHLASKAVCQRGVLWKPHWEGHGYAVALSTQKTGYQLTADSPSFLVISRLLAAQFEWSSVLPYGVSAFSEASFFIGTLMRVQK